MTATTGYRDVTYARVEGSPYLYELEETNIDVLYAYSFVKAWKFNLTVPDQRECEVWINPRYITVAWNQNTIDPVKA